MQAYNVIATTDGINSLIQQMLSGQIDNAGIANGCSQKFLMQQMQPASGNMQVSRQYNAGVYQSGLAHNQGST